MIITEIERIMKENLKYNNFSVSQEIRMNTLSQLNNKINAWNGLQIGRIKTNLNEYEKYYKKGKSWWDQTKRKTFGSIFWFPLFQYVQKVLFMFYLYFYFLCINSYL